MGVGISRCSHLWHRRSYNRRCGYCKGRGSGGGLFGWSIGDGQAAVRCVLVRSCLLSRGRWGWYGGGRLWRISTLCGSIAAGWCDLLYKRVNLGINSCFFIGGILAKTCIREFRHCCRGRGNWSCRTASGCGVWCCYFCRCSIGWHNIYGGRRSIKRCGCCGGRRHRRIGSGRFGECR